MDKSMYNMEAEKIQKLVKSGDYETAAKICDKIDWRQVNSTRMLSLVSSIYERVQDYDKAIDVLTMAYDEAPVGRRYLHKLTELALEAGDVELAEEKYKAYLEESGGDPASYVLRYKIAEAKKEPADKKIRILEAYKKHETDEQWVYKLAELYDEIGNEDRCVELCDELILWFGVGPYVDQAMALKEKHRPLTALQQNHRTNKAFYEENLKRVQQESSYPYARQEQPAYQPKEDIPKVTIAGPEMGQAVSSIDTSVFFAQDDEEENAAPEEMESTIYVQTREDLGRTRVFEKLPETEQELQMFKTAFAQQKATPVPPVNFIQPEPEPAPQVQQVGSQITLNWDEPTSVPEPEYIPEPEPQPELDNLVYIEAETPAEGLEAAIEAVKSIHAQYNIPITGVAKITGAKLNQKGLISSLDALRGKDLIILGASNIDRFIVTELIKVKDDIAPEKLYVLVDSADGIKEIRGRINNPESLISRPAPAPIPEPEPQIISEPEPEPEPQIISEPEPEPEPEYIP
ncbi:MAG: hypothetical protein KBS79_02015, partial [Lachnospiraceae bacterium]|nr:hypothetical protein [Candidatus Minthocola equi]